MSNPGKREDALLDALSNYKRRVENTIAQIEEAMIARPGDALLDALWLSLK